MPSQRNNAVLNSLLQVIYITEMRLDVFNKAALWKNVWAESVVGASKQHIILYSKSWTHTSTALEYRLGGLELEKYLFFNKDLSVKT